jgi:dihydrofolate reductase
MGKVGIGFSMSLDGFIAAPNDDIQHVFSWMSRGDTDYTLVSGEHPIPLKISPQSIEQFENTKKMTGVLVTGRRLFDMTGGWGGKHPLNVPVVVVTHNPAQEWVGKKDFTFITDGVESAIAKAQEIAGDKDVAIASASIAQQCLKLGLLEQIHIDLVPYVLGDGVRLFDHLGFMPTQLEVSKLVEAPGVTHITYQVVK